MGTITALVALGHTFRPDMLRLEPYHRGADTNVELLALMRAYCNRTRDYKDVDFRQQWEEYRERIQTWNPDNVFRRRHPHTEQLVDIEPFRHFFLLTDPEAVLNDLGVPDLRRVKERWDLIRQIEKDKRDEWQFMFVVTGTGAAVLVATPHIGVPAGVVYITVKGGNIIAGTVGGASTVPAPAKAAAAAGIAVGTWEPHYDP